MNEKDENKIVRLSKNDNDVSSSDGPDLTNDPPVNEDKNDVKHDPPEEITKEDKDKEGEKGE